jgi:NAD(P)-dependent dehydrogenase (short-subunit alcohol dehydrogenase family)
MTSDNSTIALVTGGNKGLGRETVAQLAALGMTVLLAARDPEAAAKTAGELRGTGADIHPITLDVTDQATTTTAAKQVDERYGRLDVMVNNAGITGAGSPPTDADRPRPSGTDPDLVRRVFDTNVFGVLAVTNAFLPLLLRSPAPRVVNVSSGVGSLADMTDGPYTWLPPSVGYPVSKAALNALTVQYAKEFRDSPLLINAADPGWCSTDLNGHAGPRSVAQGAAITVRLATLPADGPSGGFFNDDGPVRW